jgi:hypothetical protein
MERKLYGLYRRVLEEGTDNLTQTNSSINSKGKLMIPLGLDHSPCKFVNTRLAFLAVKSIGWKNSGSYGLQLRSPKQVD